MSDERNNVIPVPPQSRRFKADPSVELGYRVIPQGDPLEGLSLQKLLDASEDYGFESVAGPLINCAEYVELRRRIARPAAVREIARAFLAGAGQTLPGELSRVTGLSRPEAGLGNRALVAEGFATSPAQGVYRLTQ